MLTDFHDLSACIASKITPFCLSLLSNCIQETEIYALITSLRCLKLGFEQVYKTYRGQVTTSYRQVGDKKV